MIYKSFYSPITVCSIALLLILSGCGRYYQPRPLFQLKTRHLFASSDNLVYGSYTILKPQECTMFLGSNVIKKGYQPIYITLTNTTNRQLCFTHTNISMPTVSAETVARTLHSNTAARAIGFGIPAALGVYFSAVMIRAGIECPPAAPFVILPATAGAAVCATPAVVSTMNSIEKNERINADFELKSLDDQILHPYSAIRGIIFVPKRAFNPNFEITLTDSIDKPVVLHS